MNYVSGALWLLEPDRVRLGYVAMNNGGGSRGDDLVINAELSRMKPAGHSGSTSDVMRVVWNAVSIVRSGTADK